ncbi:MAG: nicotinate (nicotinamide) nucleotide adenylyltransferase [Rhabdochlamydiaceae bacterium]|nr:nicotinate (nicotinamide) nucleotide adenylyltransferase [Rhabdochlamydiaceae bacterium]
MRIGVFGGTFDPVHFGHIHLALSLLEIWKLDQVIFSPSRVSPFKEESGMQASPMQRLEMLKLALEGVPACRVIDFEVQRLGPSYTIDLVRHVKSLYAETDELFLLLGEDLVPEFSRWKEYKQILSLVTPIIGCRVREENKKSWDFPESMEMGRVPIPILEISSTQIRERIKNKLYCQHLIPEKVFDYICENKIYL